MGVFRRIYFLAAISLFMAAAPTASNAQTRVVRGSVRDSLSRRPLQAATVLLQRDSRVRHGTATDGDGYFLLPRVEIGEYELVVTYVGYRPYRQDLSVDNQAPDYLTITLSATPQAMGELVVEDTSEGGIATVRAGRQTIRPADLQLVPVPGASGDLGGYLQTMPGITVQGDRGGQVFVRGGSLDQNLALLDGIPIYQPFHIVSFFSAFPQDIVDHADVYTGAFGASYSSRLSSVVDVETRNGNKERIAGSAAVAPFLSGIQIEGPIIPRTLSFMGSVRESLVQELTPNLYGSRLPYRFGDRFGKLHALLGLRHTLSVTALSTSDRGDIAGEVTTFDGDFVPREPAADEDREVGWTNRAVGARYAFRSLRLPVSVEIQASVSRSKNEVGEADNPERFASITSREVGAVASALMRIGEVRFGGRWRETRMSYEVGGQFQDLAAGKTSSAEIDAFAEWTHSLPGAVSINPGLSLYVLPDRAEVKVDPRLRLAWKVPLPTGVHAVHVGAGRYHQLIVGLTDERDVGNVFTVWLPAADTLSLPSSWHILGGWSSRTPSGLGVALEAFAKTFSNLSVPVFTPFPSFTTDLQAADGTARGIDVRVDADGLPLGGESEVSGYVSYALSDVTYRTSAFSYHPAQHRRHQIVLMARLQRRDIGFTVQWQYGSGFPFTKSAGFDVWQRLTPDSDVSSEPGLTRVLYLEPFGGRQPNYERLDVWLDKVVGLGRARATLRAGIVNLLNRDNLFYFDLFTLRRVDQMPLIPSVGFKLELL